MQTKAKLFEIEYSVTGWPTENDRCQLCGKLVHRERRVHHAKVHIAKGEAVAGEYSPRRIRRFYITGK